MSYLEQIKAEAAARRSRLFNPPVIRRPKPQVKIVLVKPRETPPAPQPKITIEQPPPPNTEKKRKTKKPFEPETFPRKNPIIILKSRTSVRVVMLIAAAYFKVRRGDIFTRKRTSDLIVARHTAWYVCIILNYSFAQVGRSINFDHTTVMHGRKRCLQSLVRGNLIIARAVFEILKKAITFSQPNDSIRP